MGTGYLESRRQHSPAEVDEVCDMERITFRNLQTPDLSIFPRPCPLPPNYTFKAPLQIKYADLTGEAPIHDEIVFA
jgi:hypothetical protein